MRPDGYGTRIAMERGGAKNEQNNPTWPELEIKHYLNMKSETVDYQLNITGSCHAHDFKLSWPISEVGSI